MRGLLIKDFMLLKNQLNYFAILCLSLILIIVLKNASFIIGYMTYLCAMFTLSTMSYDEFDNGMVFLMSLPVKRKDYILEKYVFGFIVGLMGWFISVVLSVVYEMIASSQTDIQELFITSVFILCILIIILSILIPIELQFGSEKSRIAFFAIVGSLMALGYLIKSIITSMNIDMLKIIQPFLSLDVVYMIMIGLIIALVFLLVSYQISYKIIHKKEF